MSSAATLTDYRKLARRYETLHERWLNYAGGEAQSAFEGAVVALLKSGMHVLDAGCGTGAFASRMLQHTNNQIKLSLVDACPEMLAQTPVIRAEKLEGNLENLPFADESFDLVTCAWALETTNRPGKALSELIRVTRSGGYICVVFCADVSCTGWFGRFMKWAVKIRKSGKFLNVEDMEMALTHSHVSNIRRLPSKGPAVSLLVKKD
ncbi:MAG: methyltransferase domain-containing protein [Hyphomicrobiales bacterium]